MRQDTKKILLGIGGFIALLIFFSSYFIVSEEDQYVITLFGKPVRSFQEAGMHFKIPLFEDAIRLDKRILNWDGYPNQIPTRDKKYIIVDTTARWKIVDPIKFIQTVRTFRGAQTRLDDIIDSATREAISRHDLVETVRNSNTIIEKHKQADPADATQDQYEERLAIAVIETGRDKIQKMILSQAQPTIKEYGIDLIDVRIKRLNYEKSVQSKVFERMISERREIAQELRAEGAGKRAEIEGKTEQDLKKIESEAYRTAQEIKGKADATSTAIYARAYNRDPEFFSFYSTLETYSNSIDTKFKLILSSDGEFLELLNK